MLLVDILNTHFDRNNTGWSRKKNRTNFQQQVIESHGFQQNVQKQTGNTKKNSVRSLQLTVLCWAAGKCTTQKRQIPATSSRQSRDRKKSLQQTNFTELSEMMLTKLIWSESGGLFHLGRSSAAGISSEDWGRWSSETSPEQMREYAQPRINQRCYWPIV